MRIVYAMTTTQVTANGAPTMIHHGSHWRDDDPVVLAFPSIFSEDARYGLNTTANMENEPLVEETTAAPGELRHTRRGV